MTTTISVSAAAIKDRLIIGATSQEPTTAHLSTWLRDGFKHIAGILPPVVKGSFIVVSGTEWHTVALPNDGIWSVMHGTDYMIPGEYGVTPSGLNIDRGTGINAGEYVTVYYTKQIPITSTTTTVDTTCEFGTDWLEEVAMRYAIARAYERLAGTAPSQDGDAMAGRYRMAEESYQQALQGCLMRLQTFQQGIEKSIALRLSPFGHRPFMPQMAAGYINSSKTISELFPP